MTTDSVENKQTNKQINKTNKQTNKQTSKKTNKQTNEQTNKQTNKQNKNNFAYFKERSRSSTPNLTCQPVFSVRIETFLSRNIF
jgi:hypothetical protein